MAILPVSTDNIEYFTTIINPKVSYSSSSSGVTGSVNLFPRASTIEKELRPLTNFSASYASDEDLEQYRTAAALEAKLLPASSSFLGGMTNYLTKVNNQSPSQKKQAKILIDRFVPTYYFSNDTIKKLNIKDILVPYYNGMYPSVGWGYTNYNSLNFFTTTDIPTSSVLLYPSVDNNSLPNHSGYVSGTYQLSGAFSFDFRVNPRYQTDDIEAGYFKAGTIFHLSSSYALSLVTGSKKDENGLPVGFRLLLQLSHSADVAPSKAIPGSYPNDLIFLSDDNSLEWNKWHRVVVRWGTNLVNDGTGSFNVDGVDRGYFVIPSGTIAPKTSPLNGDPSVLCLGNYYEGTNFGLSAQSYFFSDIISEREGLEELIDSSESAADVPAVFNFNHPLKAELHEIMIRREYLSNTRITQTSGSGVSDIDPLKFAFYVPPFFIPTAPVRKYINGSGGVLQTPFIEADGSTNDPFNIAISFGVHGHYINLENFTKDFANGIYPRLHHLSASVVDYTTQAVVADDILYGSPFVRKRNLTILPCDDGNFLPNYGLLKNESAEKYVDAIGRTDYSVISLNNLMSTASLLFSKTHDTDYDPSLVEQSIGPSPEYPGLPPGPALSNFLNNDDPGLASNTPLIVFQNTKDPSSNQVTIFNISNLYYGSRILPGSFELYDSSLSGSYGKVSIKLKDNGMGNIYRADSDTPHSSWSSVGNIFYSEGVVLIKSPHLYLFGKNQYEMSFKGEQNLYSTKYELLAPFGLLNSSSNPSYANSLGKMSASMDPLDTDAFVYISSINLHDDNFNVIAKASLAQPVIKRENEKLLFKIAFDF